MQLRGATAWVAHGRGTAAGRCLRHRTSAPIASLGTAGCVDRCRAPFPHGAGTTCGRRGVRMSPPQELCIIVIGLLAGFYGAAAGGAAVVGVPGLLLLGCPPPGAVAAAHVGALGMYAGGGYRFRRAGLLGARPLLPLVGWVAFGSLIGALVVQRLDTDRLQPVILALAVLMALLVLAGPRLGLERPGEAPGPGRRRA